MCTEQAKRLKEATEKQKRSGRKLMDLLRQDVDGGMFRKIWSFLQKPVVDDSGRENEK